MFVIHSRSPPSEYPNPAMKNPLRLLSVAALVAGATAGCSTVDPLTAISGRIQEKSDAFSKLTPAQQKGIKDGYIERGYTPDMVYMVMGQPATVRAKDAALGKLEMWTYVEFRQQRADAKDNRNDPGNPHYTTQTVAAVSADMHIMPGGSAPPAGSFPPEYSDPTHNATSASMGSLYVPDMKMGKVYLFFANGQLAEIKFDSDPA